VSREFDYAKLRENFRANATNGKEHLGEIRCFVLKFNGGKKKKTFAKLRKLGKRQEVQKK